MRSRSPGRYEPLQLLGHGPYGSVSLARDGFGGNRLVAVKVLDPKVLPSRAFTRLQREFMLRRGLHNPHVAALYDLDFDDAGNCRLVSEYVGGKDILAAVSDLGPDALVDLVVQLLQALGHLHDCGLLHGAIKPSNVRLASGSDAPCLKLLDFDLRPDHEVSPTDPAGILHYAAPEVLRGQAADLSSDLYGVGMLLHQAIAGRLPFDDPAHGPGVVAWHLSRTSLRAPQGHVLTAIVERLLDPDPERRFPSTHEVIRAISLASGRRLRSRATIGGEQVLITGRFVGRDREMKRLGAACRRIQNGGGAQIFLLLGPHGIGKSRALEECRVLAQMSGIRVVQAGCGRARSAPLGALRDLVQQILVLIGSDHAVVESHRPTLREIVPDLFRVGAGPEPAPRPSLLPGEHDWMRIKNGVAEFIASVAQLRPVVLLIDDVQSIDEASLSVLRWVFQHFSGCPLMLVGALEEAQPGEPMTPAARLIENDAHEVLRLCPLQAADIEQILSGVLALPGSVRELAGLVLRLTGGVPLHVEELMRSLLEGGMIDMLAEGGVGAIDDAETPVRERALALISSRIDRLQDAQQRVLEALCVFDGAAEETDLAAAAALRPGEVEAAIRRLESADLVRVEPTCSGVRVAVRSSHIQEAVNRRISSERLASLHDRVLDQYEAAVGASPERTSAMAYHAIRGTRPAKALAYCLAAARDAMSRHAYDRARDLLDHARKLASGVGDAVAVLKTLELLAATLEGLGELDAALLVLNEIASSPQAAKAQVVLARIKIGEIQLVHGRTSAAERSLGAAAADAAALGDPILIGRADRQCARLLIQKGSPDKALIILQRARSLIESEEAPVDLAHVVGEIGEAHDQLDELDLARRCHRESLLRCLRLRDESGVALAHLNLGLVDWKEGRSADALARVKRCERLCRRLGHYPLLARALHHSGVIEARLGRLADAVRTLTQSVSMMRRLEDERGMCDGLVQLGWAHHGAGRHEMARMLIEEVVTRRGRLNDLSGVAAARVLLGRLLCVIGSLDDAETLLRTAADAAEQLDLDGIAVEALRGLAEVALRRDRPGEALSFLDRRDRAAKGRIDRAVATACGLLRTEIAAQSGAADGRSLLGRLLWGARTSRNTEVLAEGRRLAGSMRSGGPALASLRAAQRSADRSGLRELAWRVRADIGRRLLLTGDVHRAVDVMKEAMTLLRTLHDELPVRRRETYLADPRKIDLKATFSEAIDRMGVPVA